MTITFVLFFFLFCTVIMGLFVSLTVLRCVCCVSFTDTYLWYLLQGKNHKCEINHIPVIACRCVKD